MIELDIPKHFTLNTRINAIAGNGLVPFDDHMAYFYVGLKQIQLIKEECDELVEAFDANDLIQIRDAIADIIVTTDGLAIRCGFEYPEIERIKFVARIYSDPAADRNGVSHDLPGSYIHTIIKQNLVDMEMVFQANKEKVRNDGLYSGLNETAFKGLMTRHLDHIVFLCYAMAEIKGFDIEVDQRAVYESNLSKFDTDHDTVVQGVEKYDAMGVHTCIFPVVVDDQEYFVLKSALDQKDHKGKFYPMGKFLKGINFKEPQFV